MFIRRPCVWLCTVVILLFFCIFTMQREHIEKKMYPYDDLLQNGPVSASVRGTFYRAETTDASHRIYLKQADLFVDGEKPVRFSVFLIYLDRLPHIFPGNILQINGTLSEFQRASNPGQFDARAYYREQGIYYQLFGEETHIISNQKIKFHTAISRLQNRLSYVIDKGLPEKQAGVMKAVLLGQKSEMNRDIKTLYQQNGIGHLLAISGLHITILCMGFYRLLLLCRLSRPAAVPLTIGILYIYGAMTGFGIATSRAVIMMILFLAAELLQKSYDLLSALAVSALVILFQKPFTLFSCSFLFSYTAVLGVAIFLPLLQECIDGDEQERRTKRRKKRRRQQEIRASSSLWQLYDLGSLITQNIHDSLLAGISIQLTTLPVILYFYYEVPVYGILLNLFVLPFISLLVLLGSVAGTVGLICLPLSRFLFGGVCVILNLYEWLCRRANALPLHTVILGQPALWQILVYYVILAIPVFLRMKKSKLPVIWSIAVCILLLPKLHPNFSITFLDVGQGDGIFMQTPAGTTFLIDGGSSSENQVGTYCLLPFLKSQGISHLDYMLMTHADEDHISGQLELLELAKKSDSVSIGCVLLPKPSQTLRQESGYQKMLQAAEKANIPVQTIYAGQIFREGELVIRCLHPPKEYESDSANAYSTTTTVEYGDTRLLLCGDLEGDGENLVTELLRQNSTSFDILKVAHHGSKNSTNETFLKLVNPALAVISSGRNNRYGHPHKELLERLANEDVSVIQTAKNGAITIQCDGVKYQIFSYYDT
ncbi:MAG: ComEC/Rec2 family competence protein [Lachnospiraceae bacterium]|nr:ComEC/Rec2 family competence protein [Lachnospiraceae bacterium]